jgi:hypothetical protein
MAAEPLVITGLSVRKRSGVVDVKQLQPKVVEVLEGYYQLCVYMSNSAVWEFTLEGSVPEKLSEFVTARTARGGEVKEPFKRGKAEKSESNGNLAFVSTFYEKKVYSFSRPLNITSVFPGENSMNAISSIKVMVPQQTKGRRDGHPSETGSKYGAESESSNSTPTTMDGNETPPPAVGDVQNEWDLLSPHDLLGGVFVAQLFFGR